MFQNLEKGFESIIAEIVLLSLSLQAPFLDTCNGSPFS
jgi:hypothetical protein